MIGRRSGAVVPGTSLQHMSETTGDTIRLDQFLKLASCVGTGGEAKLAIQAGEVTVNGVVETRRRRKLLPGDRVVCRGEEVIVLSDQDENPG